jgi:hypothetical protein
MATAQSAGRLTGFAKAEIGIFLLLGVYGPSFSMAGQMRYVEVVLLVWGALRLSEYWRHLAGHEWRLVALFALSAIVHFVTGSYNGADPGDTASRVGSYAILAMIIPVLALMARFEPRRLLALIFGYNISYVFILFVGQSSSKNYALMPWRLGLGAAATMALAAFFAAFPKTLRHAPLALCAMAMVHLGMESRSVAAVTLLAAALTAFGLYMRARTPVRFDMLRTAMAIALLVAGAWIGATLMLQLARNGMLPEDLAAKVISQTSHSKGLIAAGRPDSLTAMYAISKRPLTGFGAGVFDLEVFSYYSEIVAESYTNGDNYQDVYENNATRDWELGIPSHSHLLGAWADAGLFAALCWFGVLFLSLYVFVRASCFANPWTPLYLMVSIMMLWDVLFSPGPHRMDIAVRLLVMFAAVRHFRLLDATTAAQAARPHFSGGLTRSFQ